MRSCQSNWILLWYNCYLPHLTTYTHTQGKDMLYCAGNTLLKCTYSIYHWGKQMILAGAELQVKSFNSLSVLILPATVLHFIDRCIDMEKVRRIKEQPMCTQGRQQGCGAEQNKPFCITLCICSPRQIHTHQTLAWPWPALLRLYRVMTRLWRKGLPFNKSTRLKHWLPSQQQGYDSVRVNSTQGCITN